MKNRLRTLLFAAIFSLVPLALTAANKPAPELLHLDGKLQIQSGKKWKEVKPSTKLAFSRSYKVAKGLALSLPNGDTLTVHKGSQFSVEAQKVGYEIILNGKGHLFSLKKKKRKPYKIYGVSLELAGSHLYLESSKKQSSILIAEGSAKAQLNLGKKGKKAKKDTVGIGEKIQIIKGKLTLTKKNKFATKAYKATLLPGFTKLKKYKRAGLVQFRGKDLKVKRGKVEFTLARSPAPILEGDEVITNAKQRARLMLSSKDRIDIGRSSTFKIDEFFPSKTKPRMLFSFAGTAKAKIVKRRQANRMIRFRGITTTIGVKGTEFFASSLAETSNIATLEGAVSVADPSGAGEMLLEKGQMTNVPKGGMPTPAVKIPQELFDALNQDFLEMAPDAPLPDLGAAFSLLAALVPESVDPPKVVGGKLEGLVLKESEALELAWDKELETGSATINGKALKTSLDVTKKTLTIDMVDLFLQAAGQPAVDIAISVKSKDGGEASLSSKITLIKKPAAAPLITLIETEGKVWLSKEGILLTVDRAAEVWSLEVNKLAVDITKLAPSEDKKTLLLPASLFAALEDGQYPVTITATDEFKMVGTKALTLIKDQSEAALVALLVQVPGAPAPKVEEGQEKPDPKELIKKVTVKEGEEVLFTFTKELKSLTLKIGESSSPLVLSATSGTLSSDQIKTALSGQEEAQFTLIAVAQTKEELKLEGQLNFTIKPEGLPAITEVKKRKGPGLSLNEPLILQADRKILKWTATLNQGKEVIKTMEFPSQEKQLALPASFWEGTGDGQFELAVTGLDVFDQLGTLQLKLSLDQSAPTITSSSIPISMELVKLGKNEMVTLTLSEPAAGIDARLNGKPWKVNLEEGGTAFSLIGNPKLLNFNPKPYRLELTDKSGNVQVFNGSIQLKTPRDQALLQAYTDSVLRKSGWAAPMTILANRGEFTLDQTKPGFTLDGKEKAIDVKKVKPAKPIRMDRLGLGVMESIP